MDNESWYELKETMAYQNYAFVVLCTVMVWESVANFDREVKYIWHSPSKLSRLLFFASRYFALSYLIANTVLSFVLTARVHISATTCAAWFYQHVAAVCIQYSCSQMILIRHVFNIYGKTRRVGIILASVHLTEILSIATLSIMATQSTSFNPICQAHGIPKKVFGIAATFITAQIVIWTLILRKIWKLDTRISLRERLHFLTTIEGHSKLTGIICFVALIINTSNSFASQFITPVYYFTFPLVILSIGSCHYIRSVEKKAYDARLSHAEQSEDHASVHPAPGNNSIRLRVISSRRYHPSSEVPTSSTPTQTPHSTTNKTFTPSSLDYESNFFTEPTARKPASVHSDSSFYSYTQSRTSKRSRQMDGNRQSSDSHIEIGSLHSRSSSAASGDLDNFLYETWNVGPYMTASCSSVS